MPRIRSCLGWSSAYHDMNTKEASFQDVKLKTNSAMALEGLRDLTSLRKIACSKPGLEEVNYEERVHRILDYLKLLHDLVRVRNDLVEYNKGGLLPFMPSKPSNPFHFEWTIPQSMNQNFTTFTQLELELTAVLMLYASALREQADALVLKTCDAPDEDGDDYVSAVKLFQIVAGILTYIIDYILPDDLASSSNKLEQSIPQLLKAMRTACLGEAQAVFASRAEAKKLSPKLVASIHLGASELFEGAASELKPNSSQIACQSFRMFLALSSELHQARARVQIGAWQSTEGRPGASCADLIDAQKRLQDAKLAADTQERWKQILDEELEFIAKKLEDYHKERSYVSMERVAPHRSPAPPAKISVKATAYVPDKVTVAVFSGHEN